MIFHGPQLLLLGIAIASCSGTFLKSLFHPETVKISKIQSHGPVQKIYLPFGVHRARKPNFLPYPMSFTLTKDCDHHKKPLGYTIPEVKPVKVQEKKPCKNETILHRVPEASMFPAMPVITPQVIFHEHSIPIVENHIPTILHQLIPCDRHENMPKPPISEATVLTPFTPEPVHIPEPVQIPEAPILPTLVMPEIPTNLIVEVPKVPCEHKDVIPTLPIYEEPGSPEPVFIPEAPVLPHFIPPEPVHIPEAPVLPTLVMPEIPTNLIVEEPIVPCEHKDVIPTLPIYEEPGSPEPVFIPEAPLLPSFTLPEPMHIPEVVHIPEAPQLPELIMPEIPKVPCEQKDVIPESPKHEEPAVIRPQPFFIPEAPALPPYIPPEPVHIPTPVQIPEAPVLPALVMPEIPRHVEDSKIPCEDENVISVKPLYEEPAIIAPAPFFIPEAPALPPYIPPEPVHIPTPVQIPEAPVLPALVMPEIPRHVEDSKIPCEEKDVISSIPIYEEPAIIAPAPFFIPEAPALPPYIPPEPVHISTPVRIPEAPVLPALVMPEIPRHVEDSKIPCEEKDVISAIPIYEEPAIIAPAPFFIPEAPALPPYIPPEPVHIHTPVHVPEAPVLPTLVMPEIPIELSTNIISAGRVPCDNDNNAPSHSFITQERISEELDTFDNFLPSSWSSSPIVVQAPMQIVFDRAYESGRPNIVQDCVDTIIKGRVLPNIAY